MPTLIQNVSDLLEAIEARANAALVAVNENMKGEAIHNLESFIESLREAKADMAHQLDIEQSRSARNR